MATWRCCCAATSAEVGRAIVPPLPPLKLTRVFVVFWLTTVVLYTLWITVVFTLVTERL
jgi:hypothetical protein